MEISEAILRELEAAVEYFRKPTGNPKHDEYHQMALSMFSSPDSSGIQEQVLAKACGSLHKGNKKLGADATWNGSDLEIKPCKSGKTVSSVNITDDQPSRLLEDMRNPSKLLVIGRCPGGLQFRWVVVCPMSDFAESRYRAMCKHWKHEPIAWPSTLEEQIRAVEDLATKRTKNNYLRSSQLKFVDIQTVQTFWVHPSVDTKTLKRRAEDDIIRRFVQTQRSLLRKAL